MGVGKNFLPIEIGRIYPSLKEAIGVATRRLGTPLYDAKASLWQASLNLFLIAALFAYTLGAVALIKFL